MRLLAKLAATLDGTAFRDHVTARCIAHPAHKRLLEDPYTRRSFERPRGFAGDAKLIDFFHGFNGPDCDDTPLGVELFRHFMIYPSCDAVRYRRSYLAMEVDKLYERKGESARIFSVACGHLQEASFSRALQSGKFDSMVALDQNERALEQIERDYGGLKLSIQKRTFL